MYRVLQFIKGIFKKKQESHIQKKLGAAYAVTTGTFVGEIFIYISEDSNNMHFLSIPKMLNREVPLEKFEYAVNNKVIEFVQVIPRNEREVCKAQYESNAKC